MGLKYYLNGVETVGTLEKRKREFDAEMQ